MNRDYAHRYFLKETSQVNPKYIVRFSFSISKSPLGIEDKRTPLPEFFDLAEYKPVYEKTTKIGTTGPHVVTIDQAYEHYQAEYALRDPLFITKREWLDKQLDIAEERLRAINLNYADAHEAIQEAADVAISQLQAITKHKLETLLSVEIELRRQVRETNAFIRAFV